MSERREGQCGEYHKVFAQMRRPSIVHVPSITEKTRRSSKGKSLRDPTNRARPFANKKVSNDETFSGFSVSTKNRGRSSQNLRRGKGPQRFVDLSYQAGIVGSTQGAIISYPYQDAISLRLDVLEILLMGTCMELFLSCSDASRRKRVKRVVFSDLVALDT